MIGRSPESIEVARPIRDGVIADYVVTEAMLRYFIRKVVGRNQLFKPRVMISIPRGVTSVESRAVHDAAVQAGAKEAYLIPEPLAAAIGAGLPIGTPTGNMVVDLGGGTTEAAVVSMNDIVVWSSVRVGGIRTDEAIMAYVRKKYNLIIGEQTAEEIKLTIGSALPLPEELQMEVRGRDQVAGLPEDHFAYIGRNYGSDGRTDVGDHRRDPPDARKDAARAGGRYYRPRHGVERRRRAVAQHRPAGDQGDGRARVRGRAAPRLGGARRRSARWKTMR